MKKEKKCPSCGFPTDQSVCPACGEKLRGVESIPLESTGFTGKNIRLLTVLCAAVLLLGVGVWILSFTGKEKSSASAALQSSSSELNTSSESENASSLPPSLLD